MARPMALVLHAPGTNRDRDLALALDLAGADSQIAAVADVARGAVAMQSFQLLLLPGGFSYGDDLGAGRLWALELRHILGEQLQRFVASGRPVLGICNGFQALVKSGLLPGADAPLAAPDTDAEAAVFDRQRVSLARNARSQFECRWVHLQADPDCRSPWLADLKGRLITCPVAHGEGRFVADDAELAALQRRGSIALRYVEAGGQRASVGGGDGYPANPNGSRGDVAGICNAAGNVLGLMPHPENHVLAAQHPGRDRGLAGSMGLPLFQAGVRFAAQM